MLEIMLSHFDHFFSLVISFPFLVYIVAFLKDWGVFVVRTGPIPRHVAFIMDGNRRYAKNKKLKLSQGHEVGAETLIKVLDICFRLGVEHVTIFAFSIENFNRSAYEVDTLMSLLRDKLVILAKLHEVYPSFSKLRVKIIGNRALIPKDIRDEIERIESETANRSRVLNVCFPYTSREEMARAIATVASKSEVITEESINNALYFGPDTPKLDLLIRTSGHRRLSDFMLWQCNHQCTIEFSPVLWPEYGYLQVMSAIVRWGYKSAKAMEKVTVTNVDDSVKVMAEIVEGRTE